MEDATITGKTIVKAKLELESPLIIGSGQDEFADVEVMKDKKRKTFHSRYIAYRSAKTLF